jgi:ABC-2 type transport system permease protein
MFFDESVKSWIEAADFADEAAARAALDAQQVGVVVIIPPAFTQDYFAGVGNSSVTVLQDPTLTIGPNVVRDMLTSMLDGAAGAGVLYKVVGERMEASGKTADPAMLPVLFGRYSDWYLEFQRALFHNPDKAALVIHPPSGTSGSADSLAGMMALILSGQLIFFSFFTGAYAMMSILQEAEEGTLARLFTTPTGRTAILAGKFLAVLFTVMLQGLVLLAAGRMLFGIRWGSTGAVVLTLLGQMVASVGLAVLLVSFIKTSKQAGPIFGGALTGLGMISGLFTTNVQMPEAFNAIGSFTPQGWVLKAWKLALAGQPTAELIVPFLVLLAMGILMFAAGALLFKRRFA